MDCVISAVGPHHLYCDHHGRVQHRRRATEKPHAPWEMLGGPEPTEASVFELKLRLHYQQEKIEYLAGGTTGAEIIEALMEKQDELEENYEKLRKTEEVIAQKDKTVMRIDSKRRELVAENERLALQCQVSNDELHRQLAISCGLRKGVMDTKSEMTAVEERLRKTETKADQATAEESNAVRSEASSLQEMVEQQRSTISEMGISIKDLEDTVAAREKVERTKVEAKTKRRKAKKGVKALGKKLERKGSKKRASLLATVVTIALGVTAFLFVGRQGTPQESNGLDVFRYIH